MTDLDLAFTPAVELATAIRERRVSPVEVVRNALARIDEVQPKLNCFCFVYPDDALAAARRAEQAVMQGDALGPLHGVPIAIKDLTPTRGKITTQGSRVLRDWVPDYDAVVVERLLAAGAILVGKTTTPEFALAGFTESTLWGVTCNPWNPARASGGSSGGSAVAVATGCVALAEGSDMGGSVRIPSAMCGIVGLKPAFGRIPFDIFPSQFDTLCHFGPLARSVHDAALFLRCTQGPDNRDILSLPGTPDIPIPLPADIRGMKLALSMDLGYYVVDPEIQTNTRTAVESLRGLGAQIDEITLDWNSDINAAGWKLLFAMAVMVAGRHVKQSRELLDPATLLAVEDGLRLSAADLKQAEVVRTGQWNRLRPVMEKYDALLCPTLPLPVPPVGAKDRDYGYSDARGYHDFEMTFPFNMVSPCPALTVPSGFTADGLPTGLQIVGRRHDEITVLRIGAALEAARPWGHHRPPVD